MPTLFDSVIEGILKYINITQKPIPLTFTQIFDIFELFGLKEIYSETFEKVSACVQWKIIPSDWIDLEFLQNYKNALLFNVSKEVSEAIEILINIIQMNKREEIENMKFEEEISIFLSE